MTRPVHPARLPVWLLVLAGLPVLLLLLFSVAVAGVVMIGTGLLAALVLPRLVTRPTREDDRTIELRASEYRRLPRSDDDR